MAIPGPTIPKFSWPKYTFPKFVRNVQSMALSTTPYKPAPVGKLDPLKAREVVTKELVKTPYKAGKIGKRVPLSKRKLTTIALVATVGLAMIPILRALFPGRSHTPKDLTVSDPNVLAPGGGVKGAFSGRRPHDPYTDHDFRLVIDGIEAGSFTKFDGLSWECDLIEYIDSMDPYPRKRPGIYRFGTIKLTKGVISNSALWDWFKKVKDGESDRRNGAISVLDRTGDINKPVLSYKFTGAFPIKWTSYRGDGKGSATLFEELELAVDQFAMEKTS